MLREARIVMPVNGTMLCAAVHGKLRHDLCKAFGGFTATAGQGSWMDGEHLVRDSVTVYDIAIEDDSERALDQLAEIAIEAGVALNQQSVYIRYPDGEVDILPLDNEPIAPLGVGRVPTAGETWLTEAGSTVFVEKAMNSIIDGAFLVRVIEQGPNVGGSNVGNEYVVNTDGKTLPDIGGKPMPRDLQRFLR